MQEKEALKVAQKAPDFTLANQDGDNVSLKDFKGKWVILYFYPKDNTTGCTIEAISFTKYLKEFEKLGAIILGVSPDSCQSHVRFIEKHNLKITLLSDPEHKVLEKYAVWQMKNMYGRKYMGVHRSTFLINPDGNIAHIWSGVNVKGHTEEVMRKLKEFE